MPKSSLWLEQHARRERVREEDAEHRGHPRAQRPRRAARDPVDDAALRLHAVGIVGDDRRLSSSDAPSSNRRAPGCASTREPRRPPLRKAEERRRGTRRTASAPARRAGAARGGRARPATPALLLGPVAATGAEPGSRGAIRSCRASARRPRSTRTPSSSDSGLLRYGTKLVPKRRLTSSITTRVVGRHGREVGDHDLVEHRPHEPVEGVPLDERRAAGACGARG